MIGLLDDLISNGNLDYELNWMLGYYSDWDFVFSQFEEFKAFQDWINNRNSIGLPNKIEKEKMIKRGQMGQYWCSLDQFTD